MKKLRMDPEALTVTSFPTVAEAAAAPGTVGAHDAAADAVLTRQTSCAGGPLCTCYPG